MKNNLRLLKTTESIDIDVTTLYSIHCACTALTTLLPGTAAGEAFRRAAQIHIELDVKHEAASTLVEAGQVLKKDDATGTLAGWSTLSRLVL